MLEAAKHVTITYNLGNLADWVNALATFAAVVVSLYLANRKHRPKINFRVSVDCNMLMLDAINISFQPVYLEIEHWSSKNKTRKKYSVALNPLKNVAGIEDFISPSQQRYTLLRLNPCLSASLAEFHTFTKLPFKSY